MRTVVKVDVLCFGAPMNHYVRPITLMSSGAGGEAQRHLNRAWLFHDGPDICFAPCFVPDGLRCELVPREGPVLEPFRCGRGGTSKRIV
jgi:hypothetical protein